MNVILPPPVESFLQKFTSFYRHTVSSLVHHLFEHKMIFAGGVLGAFLAEPLETLRVIYYTGFSALFGNRFSGTNPSSLTLEQLKHRPILLIHGNYHDPTAWMSLAKRLQKEGVGPVFTVAINAGKFTSDDRKRVNDRIEEIKAIYRKHGITSSIIDLVGHSRGSTLAYLAGFEEAWHVVETKEQEEALKAKKYWKIEDEQGKIYVPAPLTPRTDIGKIIMLGNPLTHHQFEHAGLKSGQMYEVNGIWDVISTRESRSKAGVYEAARSLREIEPEHTFEARSGHLGLLTSQKVHDKVMVWLRSNHKTT